LLHLVGVLSSRFAHDARSQEHKETICLQLGGLVVAGKGFDTVTDNKGHGPINKEGKISSLRYDVSSIAGTTWKSGAITALSNMSG